MSSQRLHSFISFVFDHSLIGQPTMLYNQRMILNMMILCVSYIKLFAMPSGKQKIVYIWSCIKGSRQAQTYYTIHTP